MNKLIEFIAQQEEEMKIKKEQVSKLKSTDTPHEYIILNNAWIKGEQNILDKLKTLV